MRKMPIGVFDSGIGGITVLAYAMKYLPGEKFIYYGDTRNAPYGTKDSQLIKELSMEACKFLISKGIKALVVACNTATSAAIQDLRKEFSIPIIGMEPALKLAVDKGLGGTILVMATPLTLREKKFHFLLENYSTRADVIPMACPGLVEIIEEGIWNGPVLESYLKEKISGLPVEKITDIVLGCTHYLFIRDTVSKIFNRQVNVLEGNEGTVRQLKHILEIENLLNDGSKQNRKDDLMVDFYFSGEKQKPLEIYREWIRENIARITIK